MAKDMKKLKKKKKIIIIIAFSFAMNRGVNPVRPLYSPSKVSLIEVFFVCFALGSLLVVDLWALFHSNYVFLVIFFLTLKVYFVTEFFNTASYQPRSVTSKSFLIYGSRGNQEFWWMQMLTVVEVLFKPWGEHRLTAVIGAAIAIVGLYMRHLAMKQCSDSFNHYIATVRKPHHKLVTSGVYAILRHPSYLGFWLYVIGTQLLLNTYTNLVLDILILHYFFTKRIAYEEWMLVNKFYGQDYVEYQKRVGVYIP